MKKSFGTKALIFPAPLMMDIRIWGKFVPLPTVLNPSDITVLENLSETRLTWERSVRPLAKGT